MTEIISNDLIKTLKAIMFDTLVNNNNNLLTTTIILTNTSPKRFDSLSCTSREGLLRESKIK